MGKTLFYRCFSRCTFRLRDLTCFCPYWVKIDYLWSERHVLKLRAAERTVSSYRSDFTEICQEWISAFRSILISSICRINGAQLSKCMMGRGPNTNNSTKVALLGRTWRPSAREMGGARKGCAKWAEEGRRCGSPEQEVQPRGWLQALTSLRRWETAASPPPPLPPSAAQPLWW